MDKINSTATSSHNWQNRPIGSVKGVGAEMERRLARLGIYTAGDLIRHFPRRYDDFSKIIPIRLMRPGNVTFRGEVERVAGRYARARKLHLTEAIISDGTGTVKAVWFNQPYLAKTIPTGTAVLVSGQIKFKNNDLALQSPAIEAISEGKVTKDTARIVPVYSETEGLSSKQLRGIVQSVLPLVDTVEETLPEGVVVSAKLMPLVKALREIHFPASVGVTIRSSFWSSVTICCDGFSSRNAMLSGTSSARATASAKHALDVDTTGAVPPSALAIWDDIPQGHYALLTQA